VEDVDVEAEWEANAPAWIELTRAGADVYRDLVNTPAFLELLPDLEGRRCLDVGCGEGHNTRLLRDRGADVTAVDLSTTFLDAAGRAAPDIRHVRADGARLPFADEVFDVVTAVMSVMDMTDPDAAIADAARVLRRGGTFQFSITHPVSTNPMRRWVEDDQGVRRGLVVGDYFDERPMTERWTFGATPEPLRGRHEPFSITSLRRPISTWLNAVTAVGLLVERVAEPCASEELAAAVPAVADTRVVPYFLIVRAVKR
jgi:SAM-dependent methyltransferase